MKFADARFVSPEPPAKWFWWLPASLAVLAAVGAAAAWREHESLAAARSAVVHSQASAQTAAGPEGKVVPPPAYDSSARQFLAERGAIWPHALAALEQVAPGGTFVLSVDFSAADESLRVDVAAPDHSSALALLDRLNSHGTDAVADLRWTLVRSDARGEGQGVRSRLVAKSAVAVFGARLPARQDDLDTQLKRLPAGRAR